MTFFFFFPLSLLLSSPIEKMYNVYSEETAAEGAPPLCSIIAQPIAWGKGETDPPVG